MIWWYLAVNKNKLLQTEKIFTSMFSKLVRACVTFSGYRRYAGHLLYSFSSCPDILHLYSCASPSLCEWDWPSSFSMPHRGGLTAFSSRFAGLKVSHRNRRNLYPIAKETWFEVPPPKKKTCLMSALQTCHLKFVDKEEDVLLTSASNLSLSSVLFSMISTDINEAREQLLLANKTKEKTGSRFHDRKRTKNDDWGFSQRTTILFYSRRTFHGPITNGIYELFTWRRPEIYPKDSDYHFPHLTANQIGRILPRQTEHIFFFHCDFPVHLHRSAPTFDLHLVSTL